MKTHYVVALVVATWCSSVQGQDLTPEQIQQLQELFQQAVGSPSSTPNPVPGQGGGQFPGQGGQFPGQGGQFPGQGGQFPGQGGQFPPGQGGFFPGAGGQFPPGQGGFFPGAGGQFPPGQGGFFPGQGGFPNRPHKPHRPVGGASPVTAPITQGGGCKFFCKAPSGQYVCCPTQ